jgi:Holliday junction resolvasome RuvABC endonuclease subunit
MSVVLAFDQAFQRTGWAVGKDGSAVACGLIDTTQKRFDSLGARFLRFEKRVRELIQLHKPDLVVFEEHRAHSGVQAAQVLGACTALIMKCCDEAGINYMAVPVRTLKKHATGSAFANKELMTAVAVKKYPTMEVYDDNVADALHMMKWGLEQL